MRGYSVTLLVALTVSLAASAVADSLPDVMRQVLQQHPDVRSSLAQLNISAERLKQAQSSFYPTLGLDGVASEAKDIDSGVPGDRSTRRADVFLRWNLFRGQGDRHGRRSAEFDQLAADAGLDDVQEQVAMQLAQAYLDVLRLRHLLALEADYIADYRRLNEDVTKRVESGRIAVADLEQARAGLIQARLQESQLRGQLRSAEAFYGLLVGAPPGELVEPTFDDSAAGQGLEALMQQALAESPRVRSALQRAAARGEDVGVAAAGLLPSFDLELRKRLVSNIDPVPQVDTRRAAQIQFNYQLPLGGGSFSRKREAVERKQAALATADSELLRARGEIAQQWAAWREAREISHDLAARVAASDKVVQAYDLQFSAARRSISDLISARGEAFRARYDLLDNRMQQLSSSAQILSLLGRLRKSMLGEATLASR